MYVHFRAAVHNVNICHAISACAMHDYLTPFYWLHTDLDTGNYLPAADWSVTGPAHIWVSWRCNWAQGYHAH